MIERTGVVDRMHVGVGHRALNQLCDCEFIDHMLAYGFSDGRSGRVEVKRPRASRRVSGMRSPARMSMPAAPAANVIAAEPRRIAGTPRARSGPISIS